MAHEHYSPDEDKRWVCTVARCLIPEVAVKPVSPPMREAEVLEVPRETVEDLLDQLLEEEAGHAQAMEDARNVLQARVAELEAAVVAHRPLCPRCRALLDGLPAEPVRPEAQ